MEKFRKFKLDFVNLIHFKCPTNVNCNYDHNFIELVI